MKLFVDDLRRCPDGWEPARTNTDAIRALAGGAVEIVSIDYNIMCEHKTGLAHLSPESFEPVAWYIALMTKKPKVYFHTDDQAGANKMLEIIGFGVWRQIGKRFVGDELPYDKDIFDS